MPLSNETESLREAYKVEGLDLIDWYRQELARVKRLARLENPEVRHTYSWVTAWLEDVIAGREPPVKPKRAPRRSSMRFIDPLGEVVPPKSRSTLTLGGAQ